MIVYGHLENKYKDSIIIIQWNEKLSVVVLLTGLKMATPNMFFANDTGPTLFR